MKVFVDLGIARGDVNLLLGKLILDLGCSLEATKTKDEADWVFLSLGHGKVKVTGPNRKSLDFSTPTGFSGLNGLQIPE